MWKGGGHEAEGVASTGKGRRGSSLTEEKEREAMFVEETEDISQFSSHDNPEATMVGRSMRRWGLGRREKSIQIFLEKTAWPSLYLCGSCPPGQWSGEAGSMPHSGLVLSVLWGRVNTWI